MHANSNQASLHNRTAAVSFSVNCASGPMASVASNSEECLASNHVDVAQASTQASSLWIRQSKGVWGYSLRSCNENHSEIQVKIIISEIDKCVTVGSFTRLLILWLSGGLHQWEILMYFRLHASTNKTKRKREGYWSKPRSTTPQTQ